MRQLPNKILRFIFMRKIIVSVLFLFVICLNGADNLSFAQGRNSKTIYNVPSILELTNNSSNGDVSVTPTARIIEKFYPIGWSKDGKFAFYTEPADEACGCYFAELVIQDLRTDKIIWQKKYNSENGGADDLQKYWTKNQKEFSRRLAQYGIVPNKDFTLLDSPLKTADHTVNVDLFSDVKIAEDTYNSKGNVILKLLSDKKGAKTVYQKTYNGKGYDGVMNAEIGGILLSPFEPRSAIVLIETRRGYEGPPNITNIKIVGATLNGGFK